MKKLFFTVLALTALCFNNATGQTTATFNWAQPGTLTPAYSAPNADNRYGEYIGNVTFSDNGVSLVIDDSAIKELSQSARFLYGYVTRTVEMRAYPNSVITITAPDQQIIKTVTWQGAKVGADYCEAYGGDFDAAQQDQAVWRASASTPLRQVLFDINVTINCTQITVTCSEDTGVEDITVNDNTPPVWYTAGGTVLPDRPAQPGLYVCRCDKKTSKVFIR